MPMILSEYAIEITLHYDLIALQRRVECVYEKVLRVG
jgi:hypothetical protein